MKTTLIFIIALLMVPFAFADIPFEVAHLTHCVNATVVITGEKTIDPGEYYIWGCTQTSLLNKWVCSCSGDYNVTLVVRDNTINKYTAKIDYWYTENITSSGGGTKHSHSSQKSVLRVDLASTTSTTTTTTLPPTTTTIPPTTTTTTTIPPTTTTTTMKVINTSKVQNQSAMNQTRPFVNRTRPSAPIKRINISNIKKPVEPQSFFQKHKDEPGFTTKMVLAGVGVLIVLGLMFFIPGD
jgi:hypothetical protein